MSVQRDLSLAYNKIGDFQLAEGNLADALASFRNGLAIREHLAELEPDNAGWQHDLTVSYSKLASVFKLSNDPANALTVLRQGQTILDRLAKLAPDNAGWRSDLAWFNDQIAVLTKQEASSTRD
jgi:Flp pilus assembly protein TadD